MEEGGMERVKEGALYICVCICVGVYVWVRARQLHDIV